MSILWIKSEASGMSQFCSTTQKTGMLVYYMSALGVSILDSKKVSLWYIIFIHIVIQNANHNHLLNKNIFRSIGSFPRMPMKSNRSSLKNYVFLFWSTAINVKYIFIIHKFDLLTFDFSTRK